MANENENDESKAIRVTELWIDNVYPSSDTDSPIAQDRRPLKIEFGDKESDKKWSVIEQTIYDTLFPVGTLYWTSLPPNGEPGKSFNPNGTFAGKWALITDAFIYAASINDDVRPINSNMVNLTNNVASLGTDGGQREQTLTIANLPAHTHNVLDSGHSHDIITRGDDYNSSNNGGANFSTDGSAVKSGQENRSRGAYADTAYTGISIEATGSNKPIDIMPPYIARYCWERYE